MANKKKTGSAAVPKEETQKPLEETKATAAEQTETPEEQLQKELAEKQNQLLTLAAEYDNFRKRSQKERESIYNDVRSEILGELLPIVDNMERALDGDSADATVYKKGVEMTFAGLITLLEKSGVQAFGAEGDAFDPVFYNAVMHVEDENLGAQTVAEVFQKGYKHGEKVLRPAMVKVAN